MTFEFARGGYGTAANVVQADPSHPDIVNIPDAGLLHGATFQRAGLDLHLHLHGHDGQHLVISGYFAGAHPPALVAPGGERLTADAVALLGDRHADAQPTNSANDATHHAGPYAIGHVDKIVGDVTVEHNGVTVTLHAGDAIYQNDIVKTGSASSISISLFDGTALHLVANARMALNDYAFDANSSANHALFTLLEGSFAFIAGKAAHGGDIRIATPVATMNVHEGTTGWAHELSAKEIAAISAKLGNVTFSFAVVNEHGADSHGIYNLLVNGSTIGNIGDPNLIWYLDLDGNLISMPLDHSQESADGLPQDFLRWLDQADVTPSSLDGIHGSGSAIDPSLFPQLINLNQLGPNFGFDPNAGGSPFSFNLAQGSNDPIGSVYSDIFIWNGVGNWDLNPADWNQGFAPTSTSDLVFIESGKSSYSADYSIASLTVDFGATLNIFGGSLTTAGLTNAGLIEINSSGSDPALVIDGGVALTGRGTIEMIGPTADNFILGVAGSGATLTNVDNLIEGSGNIGAGDGHLTFINDATVDATPLLAADSGLLIVDTGNTVQNFGVLEATLKGELVVDDRLFNFGSVEAIGAGSSVVIDNDSRDVGGSVPGNADGNGGIIEAIQGGTLTIEDSTIVQSGDGLVLAGAGSEILLQDASILEGFVSVQAGGEIETVSGTDDLIDTSGGQAQPTLVNAGKLLISDNSTLTLGGPLDIVNAGTIELASTGDKTLLEFNQPLTVLSGGGDVLLDGGLGTQDIIDGQPGATAILENSDNTISGAGSIGQGTGALALQNDAEGTVDADLSRRTLLIATGANTVLNAGLFEAIDGGILQIESDLDNSGNVFAHKSSEVLIEAEVTNEDGAKIIARGRDARVEVLGLSGDDISVDNSGDIAALHRGTVSFEFTDITNTDTGRIVAVGEKSRVDIERSTVDNSGVIAARRRGSVAFDSDRVDNASGGLVNATGQGSDVSFERSHIENSGTISADHGGEVVFDRSQVDNEHGGTIEADGRGSKVRFNNDHVDNSGRIEAGHGGEVEFDRSQIDNERHGTIVADGRGSQVEFDQDHVENSGRIEAERGGRVEFDGSFIDNQRRGVIEANGKGSQVDFDDDVVDNAGLIEASDRGDIEFYKSRIDNAVSGTIEADGRGSRVQFNRDDVHNSGRIEAERGGRVEIDRSYIDNERRGIIEAEGRGSEVEFDRDRVDNSGRIEAERGGKVEFDGSYIDNGRHGVIEADGKGSQVDFEYDDVDNAKGGTIEADGRGSKVSFDRDEVQNSGRIEAEQGGKVEFDRSHIDNQRGGVIAADGRGSDIEFDRDHIFNSGRVEAEAGGKVEFDGSYIDNERHGVIEADGKGSQVDFEYDDVDNSGLIKASDRGEVDFEESHIDNTKGGTIEADGRGSKVRFARDGVDNSGWIGATWGGSVLFEQSWVDNGRGGEIAADGPGSDVAFDRDQVDNSGRVEAGYGGEVEFDQDHVDNSSLIEAERGGRVEFDGSFIDNQRRGIIEADGKGSQVDFDDDVVDNAGLIEGSDRGDVEFYKSRIDNAVSGMIEADGRGSKVQFDRDDVDNSGRIEAEHGGKVEFDRSHIDNERGGIIEAEGRGSEIEFDRDHVFNSGRIEAEAGGQIQFDGSHIDNERRGIIEAEGRGSQVEFEYDDVDNSGLIKAGDGGEVEFDKSYIDNAKGGTIEADGRGSKVRFERDGVDNCGWIGATWGGSVLFEQSWVDNGRGGEIAADGRGSDVEFDRDQVDNSGRIEAEAGGQIKFDGSQIDNERHATIEAGGKGSSVTFDRDHLDNFGRIEAEQGGDVAFDKSDIDNAVGGSIEAAGRGSRFTFDRDQVDNSGTIDAAWGGLALFEDSDITNQRGGEIEADGRGSQLGFEDDHIHNSGVIEADDQSEIRFTQSSIDNGRNATIEADGSGSGIEFDRSHVDNSGQIEAGQGGTVSFDKTDIDNSGGVIVADGKDSTVDFDDSDVFGGKLTSTKGGLIQVQGTSTFGDLTITSGTQVDVDGGSTLELTGGIDNFGTISVEFRGELDLVWATVDGGLIENHSVIDVFHTDSLENLTVAGGDMVVERGATLHIERTVYLDGVDVTNKGGIIVDAPNAATLVMEDGTTIVGGQLTINGNGTLDVEHGDNHGGPYEAVLDGVAVTNEGAIDVGQSSTATLLMDHGTAITNENPTELVLGTGSSIDGDVTVGASGKLDVDGGTFGGATTISDSGIFDIAAPFTLGTDLTVHLLGRGSVTDTGIITVAGGTSGTLAGATFGQVDIGSNATLTLDDASATAVDFTGSKGTLVLATPSSFTGTVEGLTHGDVIDLVGVSATTVTFKGSTLEINGVATAFSVTDGLPAGDTFAFKSDGHGGTLIFDQPASSKAAAMAETPIELGDNFAFHPGMGSGTSGSFEPRHDASGLDHVVSWQPAAPSTSLIPPDDFNHAWIEPGHHNALTPQQFEAALASAVHLH
jgi:hypothetical protein